VYSPSGRAAAFAAARGVTAVRDGGLAEAIGTADLVVACSGTVGRVLDAELVAHSWATTGHPHVVVDLALRNDVDPAVGRLPGVRLINLDTIRLNAPDEHSAPVELAQKLVTEAAADFEAVTRARELEAAVVAERHRVLGALEAEASRIRAGDVAQPAAGAVGPEAAPVTRDDAHHERVVRSLRRRTRAQLHSPTVRARTAARAGDDRAYRAALAELAAIPPAPVPVRASSSSGTDGVVDGVARTGPGAAEDQREDAALRR
jgi:glutamyl-tRNA reductase